MFTLLQENHWYYTFKTHFGRSPYSRKVNIDNTLIKHVFHVHPAAGKSTLITHLPNTCHVHPASNFLMSMTWLLIKTYHKSQIEPYRKAVAVTAENFEKVNILY